MIGFLLVDKLAGITSHDAVRIVRKRLGIKRVGHAGTLDPISTGLLVMAVGRATRFLRYLSIEPKVYEGAMKFGEQTTTYDSEGEVTGTCEIDGISLEAIREAASQFVGELRQVPPMYSAVKVQGERLYKLARQGESVERKARDVMVRTFDVMSYSEGTAEFRVVCSGGTYVRSLVHDLALAMGLCAHMSALRRTAMGGFTVQNASPASEVTQDQLIPLDVALETMPCLRLTPGQIVRVRQGQALQISEFPNHETMGVLDAMGNFVAVLRSWEGEWWPECVLQEGIE